MTNMRFQILIWIEKLVKSSLDEAVHVASVLHSCTRILTECIQISPPDILREFIHQFIRTCKGVCVDSTSSSDNKWKTSNSLAVLTTLLTRYFCLCFDIFLMFYRIYFAELRKTMRY